MKPHNRVPFVFPAEKKFKDDFVTRPDAAWKTRSAVASSFFHQTAYVPEKLMPTKQTKKRARAAKRQGKKPTTQAGDFVKENMRKLKRGSGNVRSKKQAIAIGLSEARRSGVKLPKPAKGKASSATRKKASRDKAIGSGRTKPSPARSRGAKKAARTRARRYGR